MIEKEYLSLDEQLKHINAEINSMEKYLIELKQIKRNLEKQIDTRRLCCLNNLIKENKITFEDLLKLLKNE